MSVKSLVLIVLLGFIGFEIAFQSVRTKYYFLVNRAEIERTVSVVGIVVDRKSESCVLDMDIHNAIREMQLQNACLLLQNKPFFSPEKTPSSSNLLFLSSCQRVLNSSCFSDMPPQERKEVWSKVCKEVAEKRNTIEILSDLNALCSN